MDLAYIRAINMTGTQEFPGIERATLAKVMEEVGIPAAALDDVDMLISFRSFCLLYEVLAQRIGRPNIGLELNIAGQPNFPQLGPMMALAHFTTTAGSFFNLCLQYWEYHSNAFTLEIIRTEGETNAIARMVGRSYVLPSRQWSEGFMTNVFGIARVVTRLPGLVPTLLRFQHSRPNDVSLHEHYFRCPIEFDAEHTEIHFPASYLNLPTHGRLSVLRPLIGYHVRRRISKMPGYDQSAKATVALAIPSILGTGKCNLDHISEALGVSPKTLQRQLQREGTSFSEILELTREAMARQMLTDSTAPVSKIAGLLDYANNAAFTLAFNRWTGLSPRKFRQTERQQLGLA